jgi:hypothetical protein
MFTDLFTVKNSLNIFDFLGAAFGTVTQFIPHRKHNTSPFCRQELRPLDH